MLKQFETSLQAIRDTNGAPHPWYMSGKASIDDGGNIRVTTHLESHIQFSGFTGGMVAAFMNKEGQALFVTPLLQYGVDGYNVPSCFGATPSPRTVETTFHTTPDVFDKTEKIDIFLFHAGKNRLVVDIGIAFPVVVAIVEWIIKIVAAANSSTVVRSESSSLTAGGGSIYGGSTIGVVEVFEHNDFQGRKQSLPPGRYDLRQLTIGNDVISSVKVPPGWRVTLFQHAGFAGQTKVLTASASSLPGFNDNTSSIVVEGPAVVFEHNNFGGRSQVLPPGRYDLAQLSIGNDVISSVKVPFGLRVTLFEHAGFKGQTRVLVNDAPSLPGFNDKVSSIVVERI